MEIWSASWDDTSDQLREGCAELWAVVWPPGRTAAERDRKNAGLRGHEVHVARRGDEVLAVARTFVQTISIGGEKRDVVALASVCSHPDHRGLGYGEAVAQAGLRRSSPLMPALFQTGVREFYERLECRVINNQIATSAPDVDAFTDDCAMIYPANATWDDNALVDLMVAGW